MAEGLDRGPILRAFRTHVALDADVSDALTALHAREGARLSELLRETRVLAGELDPSKDGIGSRLDLETWLGTILRGPHDRTWFDTRMQCGRRGWADMPPLASAVLLARVRHRLTDMAGPRDDPAGTAGHRVASALGRLFDLETAILVLHLDVGAMAAVGREGADVIRSAAQQAAIGVGNALAVIETSAYLIGRYCGTASPRRPDIDRHLDRIARQVDGAKKEVRQLLQAVKSVDRLLH